MVCFVEEWVRTDWDGLVGNLTLKNVKKNVYGIVLSGKFPQGGVRAGSFAHHRGRGLRERSGTAGAELGPQIDPEPLQGK